METVTVVSGVTSWMCCMADRVEGAVGVRG